MNINSIGMPGNPAVPSQPSGDAIQQQQQQLPASAEQMQNNAQNPEVKGQPPIQSAQAPPAPPTPDAPQQAAAAPQGSDAASQVEVTMKDILSHKLSELTKSIETRAALISSLPENIQKAVRDILQQGALTENNLPEGLANLLKSQNMTGKQLLLLANLIDDTAQISTGRHDGGKLPQLLEKLFLSKPDQPSPVPQQDLAELTAKLNSRQISPEQFRQALQSLTGEILSQNTSLAKDIRQLFQLLFSQTSSQPPPEAAKLASFIKQPDLNFLWQILQEDKSPSNAQIQQRLLDLANQLTKNQISPSQAQQTLSNILTPENLKLLEKGLLLKNLTAQLEFNPPPHLAQTAKETTMPELLQMWNLSKALTVNGGRDFNVALANKLEQNLTMLANNLLTGSATAEETKTSLDNLMNILRGFNRMGAEEENLARNFLRQTMSSIPSQISQASAKYNMPELTRAWLMTKLAALEAYKEQTAIELKQAANSLRSLSSAMQRSSAATVAEHQSGGSTLSFSTPIYFGSGQVYPAYIHIYQECGDDGPVAKQRKKTETWMRITLDTENIGPVDTFFRLYEQDKLDIRVRFQNAETASEFSDYLPEIRRNMKNSSLELTDLSVRSNS